MPNHGILPEDICHADETGLQFSFANKGLAVTEEGNGMGWNSSAGLLEF